MLNPSYLIKSRHDIFYFRYPLPTKVPSRVSVSLKTRCPKEALRLAKSLEYYSHILINEMDLERMDHAEIISILKSYYAEKLESEKARIDKEGPLDKRKVDNLQLYLEDLNEDISNNCNDILEWELEDGSKPFEEALSKIMDQQGVSFEPDSREYEMLKDRYKFVSRNYCKDLLAYNERVLNFSLLNTDQNNAKEFINHHKPEHKLGKVIQSYMGECKSSGYVGHFA